MKDGNMVLGHAQDIYFAEFDGIKNRKYYIQVMGE
ncbi:MAG: YjbQ family protein [[Clostridium] symbiosum]